MNNEALLIEYKKLNDRMGEIISDIRERDIAWQHLAEYGLNVMAMIAYRRKFKCTVEEARAAIESFQGSK